MDVESEEEIIETKVERVIEPPSVFELPWTDDEDRNYRHKKKGFLVIVSNKIFTENDLKTMKKEIDPDETRIYKNRYGTFLGKYIVEALRNTIVGLFPDYSAKEQPGEGGAEGEEGEGGELGGLGGLKEPQQAVLKPQEPHWTDESSGKSADDNSDNAMDYWNYDSIDEDEVDEEESEIDLEKKKDPSRAYLESSDSVYSLSPGEEPRIDDEEEETRDRTLPPPPPVTFKKKKIHDLPPETVDMLNHETSSSEDDGGFLFDAPGPDFRQRVMTMNQWKMKLPKIKNKVRNVIHRRTTRKKTEMDVFKLPLTDEDMEADEEMLHQILETMQEQVRQRRREQQLPEDPEETTHPQQLEPTQEREARRQLLQAKRENRKLPHQQPPEQQQQPPLDPLGQQLRSLLLEDKVDNEEEPEVGLEDVEGGDRLFAETVGDGKTIETDDENEVMEGPWGDGIGNWSTPTDSDRDSLDVEMEDLTYKQKRELRDLRKQKWNLFDKIKDHWLINASRGTDKLIKADTMFIMDYPTLLSAMKIERPSKSDASFVSNRQIFMRHPVGHLAQSHRLRSWPASLRRKGPIPSRTTMAKRSKFRVDLEPLKTEQDNYETWRWAIEGKLKLDDPFQELEDLARMLHPPGSPLVGRQQGRNQSGASKTARVNGTGRGMEAVRIEGAENEADGDEEENWADEENSEIEAGIKSVQTEEVASEDIPEEKLDGMKIMDEEFAGEDISEINKPSGKALGKAELIAKALKQASNQLQETIDTRKKTMNQISNLIKNQLLEHDHKIPYERYELKLPKDSSIQKAPDMYHVLTTSQERSLGTGGDKRVIDEDSLKDRRNLLLSSGTVIFDITQSRHDLYEAWWFLKELITRMEDERNELERIKKEQADRIALTVRPDDPLKAPERPDPIIEPIITETIRPIQHIILLTNFLTWTHSPDEIKTNVNEVNFLKRKPHPDYRDYYALENFIYSLGVNRHFNLRTTVIHCGIPIGREEDILMFLFKQAWDNTTEIPLWGTGQNIPPLIHVDDLTKLLAKIIVSKSYPLLVFAISRSEQTLNQIAKQVAMRFGFSRIRHQPNDDYEWKNTLPKIVHDLLRQNIKLQYIAIHPFMENSKFQSPFGLQTDEVVGELKKSRKLAALTVLLLGPPSKIKNEAAEIISNFYDIPVINKRSLIDDVMRAAQNARDAAVIEKEEKAAREPDAEPEEPPQPDPNIEEMKILSNAQHFDVNRGWLTLSLKTLLESVHVKTHGYILLDFPSRYSDAAYLFSMKPPTVTEGAEDEGQGAGVAPPQFIIHIDGPKEFFERQEVYTSEIHRRIGDDLKDDMQEYLDLKAKDAYSLKYFKEMNFKIHWFNMCKDDVLGGIFQILGPPRVPGGLEKFIECLRHVKSIEMHDEYRRTFREYQDQIFSAWQKFDINAALQSYQPKKLKIEPLEPPEVEPIYYARPKFKDARGKKKLRAQAAGYREMAQRWLDKSSVFAGLTSVGRRQHWNTLRELWDEYDVVDK